MEERIADMMMRSSKKSKYEEEREGVGGRWTGELSAE